MNTLDWDSFPWLHGRLLKFFSEDYEWCQEWNAKNSKEQPCNWDDTDACYFCFMAGVYKLYHGTHYWDVITERLKQVFKNAFWEGQIMVWNDQPDRTQQELLEFLTNHKL